MSEHDLDPLSRLVDPATLARADAVPAEVPRGEPRGALADVATALAERAPAATLEESLDRAAELVWTPAAAEAAAGDDVAVRRALAYRLALPYLARHPAVKEPLVEVETILAQLDDIDRAERGPVLARAAIPALAADVELLKDEGYRFVHVFPPEGSEGIDVVGKAAIWLTKRMTVDGDELRLAMRRFLAVLAEEIEIELPLTAELIDALLADPMPPHPPNDRPFLALARGLVEEAIAERGFPW